MALRSACLGHARIGLKRELKTALESHWSGTITREAVEEVARTLRRRHWSAMKRSGVDIIPSNDFSLYDHVLDTALMFGAVPERFRAIKDESARYFAMARGLQDPAVGIDVAALEMTKWFDTNYHYLVPELSAQVRFGLFPQRLLAELEEARALGITTRPVLLGPVSFLLLSKSEHGGREEATLPLLDALLPSYVSLLRTLRERGVVEVQLDEPCLVLDLSAAAQAAYHRAFAVLASQGARPEVALTSYFGELGGNLPLAVGSGFERLHVDLTRGAPQLDAVLEAVRPTKLTLSLGLIDGRNIWRADLDAHAETVRRATAALGETRVVVATSCSLLHVPVDLASEVKLDAELRRWLAFGAQKLRELRALADVPSVDTTSDARFEEARKALRMRRASARTRDVGVRARMGALSKELYRRAEGFEARAADQRARFGLPLFPTTTIGSFPQTSQIRKARALFRKGELKADVYLESMRDETRRCIELQEQLGLDVLVHGEFERTDMVEFFGEQLEGFAFTENGWVQSYGSRCVKPPLIFGDVQRRGPMTVEWAQFAQSISKRPVKGMLTGPVTILQWSFVRDDLSRREVCTQIALALRDEVSDLERADIGMIQVDEPAIREGLPLRKNGWGDYLAWSVDAFLLATCSVRSDTQIHSHMCYSDFGDILPAIARMDADVLSIESSRSKLELLADFARFAYPNDIGPGVYDIHSPRVPTRAEMSQRLLLAARVIPSERLWVNPDCGLKTRAWPETEAALRTMVAAAKEARQAPRSAEQPGLQDAAP